MGTQSRMKTKPLSRERRKLNELTVKAGSRQERRAAASRLRRDDVVWRNLARHGRAVTKIS